MLEYQKHSDWENIGISIAENEEHKALRDSLIDEAIDSLPERRKEVYLLSRHERLSYQQIADQLGISKDSVRTHLQLASKDITKFIRERLVQWIVLFELFFKNF